MKQDNEIKFINREMAILAASALLQYFAFQKIFCDMTCHVSSHITVNVYEVEHLLVPKAYLFSSLDTIQLPDSGSWCNTFTFEWS